MLHRTNLAVCLTLFKKRREGPKHHLFQQFCKIRSPYLGCSPNLSHFVPFIEFQRHLEMIKPFIEVHLRQVIFQRNSLNLKEISFFGLHWIVIDLKALLPLVEPLCTVYWVAIYSERGVQIADVVENTETPKHWDTKALKKKTLKHSTVRHLQMQWHTKHAHNAMTCQKYLQHF